jgi:NADPH2:quinone reductase
VVHAVGYDVKGGPEALRPVELPVPAPGPGQVLVRVAYAGVAGPAAPYAAGEPGQRRRPGVPGCEVSGRVAATGPGVSGVAVGDLVAAYLPDGGGYAQYAVAPAEFAFPLDGVPLRDGGAAAVALTTAYGVLTGAARLRAGDTVLIHAAAGAVGSAAAQIARALGAAAVFGTVCSALEAEQAKRLGYDAVHHADDFADQLRDLDVVLDPIGGPVRLASLALLAPFGRLAVCGEAAGETGLTLPVLPFWKSNRSLTGYHLADLARRAPRTLRGHALSAFALLASGAIRCEIAAQWPLSDAAEAHAAARTPAGTGLGPALLAVDPRLG